MSNDSEILNNRYGLDYYRVTLPYDVYLENVLPDGWVSKKEFEEKEHGLYGYNRTLKTPVGRIFWHNDQRRMKVLLECAGQELEEMTARGFDHLDLLLHTHGLDGLARRIDFAADTFTKSDPDDLWQHHENDTFRTAVKSAPLRHEEHGEAGGYTVEFGDRENSNRFMRCYRRIPNLTAKGLPIPEWVDDYYTRLEIEIKNEAAPKIALAMRQHGIIAAGKAALRKFIRVCEIDWIKSLLEGDEGAYIEPTGRKDTDSYKWFKDTVFPALDAFLERADPEQGLDLIGRMYVIGRKRQKQLLQERTINRHINEGHYVEDFISHHFKDFDD